MKITIPFRMFSHTR